MKEPALDEINYHTLYKGIFLTWAPALQTASETAKIAFAPNFQ